MGKKIYILFKMDMSLSKLQEGVKDREAGYAAVHGVTKRPNNIYASHLKNTKVNRASLVAQMLKNLPAMWET